MPFQYEGYRSPFANSIAELMLRRGDIAARQAEQSGNAWAGAAQTIGQSVAAIPAQIQQAKRADTIDQMNALTLKHAQGEDRSQTIFESELKNPGNRNPDGSINDAKITAALQGKDVGAWMHWADISQRNQKNALETAETIAKLQTADLTNQEKQRQAVAVRNEYLGKLAFSGEQILNEKPDDPLHARDTVLATVGRAAADGQVTEDQAKSFMAQTAHAGPDQLRHVFASFVPPDMRAKLEKEAADTAKAKSEADLNAAKAANVQKYGRETAPDAQHVQFLLDGKPVMGSFIPSPTGGTYTYNNEDVTGRAKVIPPASMQVNVGQQSDAKEIAAAIIRGEQPPDVKGLYRNAGPVRAELARQGYDLTKANLDWTATQKHLATLNGAQQTRLRQAISTASDSLGVIEDLATQWDGGKFPLLNKANLAMAKAGGLGAKAQQIATNLEAQITDVTSELGNVYMGGNSPTDHALSLAGKNLSADWTKDQLLSAIKLARTNLQIRSNSITNAGAITASSQQAPPPAPAATPSATTPTSTMPANVSAVLKGQKPGRYTLSDGSVWLVQADGSIQKGS